MRCIVVNAVAVFSHSNERLFDLPDDFSDRFELYGAEADIARGKHDHTSSDHNFALRIPFGPDEAVDITNSDSGQTLFAFAQILAADRERCSV